MPGSKQANRLEMWLSVTLLVGVVALFVWSGLSAARTSAAAKDLKAHGLRQPLPSQRLHGPNPDSPACTKPAFTTRSSEGSWGVADNVLVNNNVWGPSGNDWSQQLNACSATKWNVSANFQTDGGAIQSYADTEYNLSGKTIAQYKSLETCFGEEGPTPSGGEWDYAYDMWLDNWDIEVMVWNDWTDTNIYPPPDARAVTIDGVGYHEFKGGGSNEWIYTRDTRVRSGCFDAKAILEDLIAHPSTSGITSNSSPNAIEYGVEIASTNGPEEFRITNASLKAS